MGRNSVNTDDEEMAYLKKKFRQLNRGRKPIVQDIVDMCFKFTYDYFKKVDEKEALKENKTIIQ